MKKILFLLLTLLPSLSLAQYPTPQTHLEIPLNLAYNLAQTGSNIYCNSLGDGNQVLALGKPAGGGFTNSILVSTVGSSTTISAVTTGLAPFEPVAVGDILIFNTIVPGTTASGVSLGDQTRVVTAKASNDSVTVDLAIDLSGSRSPSFATGSGYFFRYRNVKCGTTNNDGWIPTAGFYQISFTFQADTLNLSSGGISVNIQCKDGNSEAQPVNIFSPAAYTVQGITSRTRFDIFTGWAFCRLGYFLTGGASGAQSITTTAVLRK